MSYNISRMRALSYEPSLHAFDIDPNAKLYGRLPTDEEAGQFIAQMNTAIPAAINDFNSWMLGNLTLTEEDEQAYLDKVNATVRSIFTIIEGWDALMGFNTATRRAFAADRGVKAWWHDDPRVQKAFTQWDEFTEYFRDRGTVIYDARMRKLRRWETVMAPLKWIDENVAKPVRTVVGTAATVGAAIAGVYGANKISDWLSSSNTRVTSGLTPYDELPDLPNLVGQAFLQDGMAKSMVRRKLRNARRVSNRAGKILKGWRSRRVGQPQGVVASFGDVTIEAGTHFDDIIIEKGIADRLMDYATMEEFYDLQPGSIEAYMVGDMFDLEVYADPPTHHFFKKFFKKIGKVVKKVAGFVAPVLTGGAGLVAGFLANRGSSGGGQVEQQYQPQVLPPPSEYYAGRAGDEPAPSSSPGILDTLIGLGKEWLSNKINKRETRPGAVSRYGLPLGAFAVTTDPRGRKTMTVVPISYANENARIKAETLLNAFLTDPDVIASGEDGPFTARFERSSVMRFDGYDLGVGSTTRPDLVPFLSSEPYYNLADGPISECGHLFDRKGELPDAGVFYQSSLVNASLGDLPKGVYGQIKVSERPFTLIINRRYVNSRARISFVHEMMHAISELLKLGMSHEQLHALSVMITTEVLPGYLALDKKLQATK